MRQGSTMSSRTCVRGASLSENYGIFSQHEVVPFPRQQLVEGHQSVEHAGRRFTLNHHFFIGDVERVSFGIGQRIVVNQLNHRLALASFLFADAVNDDLFSL